MRSGCSLVYKMWTLHQALIRGLLQSQNAGPMICKRVGQYNHSTAASFRPYITIVVQYSCVQWILIGLEIYITIVTTTPEIILLSNHRACGYCTIVCY